MPSILSPRDPWVPLNALVRVAPRWCPRATRVGVEGRQLGLAGTWRHHRCSLCLGQYRGGGVGAGSKQREGIMEDQCKLQQFIEKRVQ